MVNQSIILFSGSNLVSFGKRVISHIARYSVFFFEVALRIAGWVAVSKSKIWNILVDNQTKLNIIESSEIGSRSSTFFGRVYINNDDELKNQICFSNKCATSATFSYYIYKER